MPEKTPITAKSNCIFNSKLRPDRALTSFLRNIHFFQFWTNSWGTLGPKLDQSSKLGERPAVVKIPVF